MNKIETDPFVHIIHDDIDLPKNIINKTLELANTFENKKRCQNYVPNQERCLVL